MLSLSAPSDDRPRILLQPPTADEITSYFALINPLRYSQPHQPIPSPSSPPLNGLTITAYNAGHSLGGTIWHIQHGMESVVYAVDWNLTRENVIGGAAWLGGGIGGGSEVIEQLRKPTALVCSSRGVERTSQATSRQRRDEILLEHTRTALSRGGIVLVPSDSSARVLELAWLFEQAWRQSMGSSEDILKNSKLYIASKTVGSTMDFARSMIEWMDENVTKSFESETDSRWGHKRGDSKRNNDITKSDGELGDQPTGPFSFKFLRLVEREKRLEKILSTKGAKVIIASDTSLEWGYSKQILRQIADDPNNLIILTETNRSTAASAQPSLGLTLWRWYEEKANGVAAGESKDGQSLEQVLSGDQGLAIPFYSKMPLGEKELPLYQQYVATQKQLQSIQTSGAANLENVNDMIEEVSEESSSSSDESDDERQGKSLNFSSRMLSGNKNKATEDKDLQGISALLRKPGFYDWDIRGKKGREAVFPYINKRKRVDEYGELIRPEEYLRAEERDEIEGRDLRDEPDGKRSGLGEKRKWGEAKLVNGNGSRRVSTTKNRQRLSRQANSDPRNGVEAASDSSSEESESEAREIHSGPSKLETSSTIVQARLRLAYVDFSGLHDQRSLSMLIPLIQPRKTVLIGGTESETKWLAEECKQKLSVAGRDIEGSDDILVPAIGETVTASMDTHAWTVKLSRDLVKRIQWQDVGGLGVVTLMGKLASTPSDDSESGQQKRKRQKVESEDSKSDESKGETDISPTLDVLPANLAAATRTATQPLHVGDLRLADLRRILSSSGHTAEFRGEGTLVIDNLVAVRKTVGGQIEVESSGASLPKVLMHGRESSFHTVKRRIYEGLAVIAGG